MKRNAVSFLRKSIGMLFCVALLALNYSEPMRTLHDLSTDVHIQAGQSYILPLTDNGLFQASSDSDALAVSMGHDETLAEATGASSEKQTVITIKMLGFIPVKQITAHIRDTVVLVPGGSSIGVQLHTQGALVVGLSTIMLSNGEEISPAAMAGIQAGDLIEAINDIEIKSSKHLANICNESKEDVRITLLRKGERLRVTLRPVMDPSDGQLRMGMWVRDSTAGVGTLSFYDPTTKWYAALGHAITDVDTRTNLTVRNGEILQSDIVDIVQGAQGEPGELRGTFGTNSLPMGTIEINSQYGIYGRMYQKYQNPIWPEGVPMAYPEEAVVGPAQLLTTVSDSGIQAFDCTIIKVNPQSSPMQKGMVLEITDKELLNTTGGIVQGMSGSPILQNGKLIGVVTHVFINDPTKGYCMYTEWMMKQINT